jgi:protein ImuA
MQPQATSTDPDRGDTSPPATLASLRRAVGAIDPGGRTREDGAALPPMALGFPDLDAALGGGLAMAALHEIGPAGTVEMGAATGFALAFAARAMAARRGIATLVWVQHGAAAAAGGRPYGPGLAGFGLPPAQVALIEAGKPADVLRVAEEALRSGGAGTVIAELPDDLRSVDLTATRRLALAARAGGALALLLAHRMPERAAAAVTRWRIAAVPGPPDPFGGLGPAAFAAELTKNRHGPRGLWHIAWDHDARIFRDAALSLGLAAPAADRPSPAPRIQSKAGQSESGPIGRRADAA